MGIHALLRIDQNPLRKSLARMLEFQQTNIAVKRFGDLDVPQGIVV
jgi:hypothetical protein